jgi:hypothetical protein
MPEDYLANTWWHLLYQAGQIHCTRMNDLATGLAAITRVASTRGEAAAKEEVRLLTLRMQREDWGDKKPQP